MRLLIVISLLFPFYCFSQIACFKETRLKVKKEYYNSPDTTIIFPTVITKNSIADSRINNSIRKAVIEEYDDKKSLLRNIRDFIDNMILLHLSYDVTLNKKILSLSIFKESCGAYCYSTRTYFNFDIATGKEVTISDIILENKLDSFTALVKADKTSFLEEYKKEQNEEFKDVADSSTHNWIVDKVDHDCQSNISTEQFSLSPNTLEIFDPCEFPHAIRSFSPFYELKYPYKQISRFLKPGIKLH